VSGDRCPGKVVVITGAARGQGAAEARALAAEGAMVIATDVLDDEGTRLAAEIGEACEYRHLDVTEPGEWQSIAAHLLATHGHVDGLVNNAGVAARGRLPDVDLDVWDRTFRINVTGPMLGMKYLVPLMGAGASIVNICSVAAMSGHVAAPYTASKWALRGLSRSASLELGSRGIRVNSVMPGLVDTPMMEGASPAFPLAAIAETPLGRAARAEEIAPLIVYLISDESSYVSGAEIAIDGGMTSHVSHKRIADATAAPDPTQGTAS
jgi:NAD(P)-dependent dehydrogenase (short-subunit alcohol dehydrogenase family)